MVVVLMCVNNMNTHTTHTTHTHTHLGQLGSLAVGCIEAAAKTHNLLLLCSQAPRQRREVFIVSIGLLLLLLHICVIIRCGCGGCGGAVVVVSSPARAVEAQQPPAGLVAQSLPLRLRLQWAVPSSGHTQQARTAGRW